MPPAGHSQVPAASRALRVLRFLASQPDPVPLDRILRACDLPRSTAYHLLNTMIAEGFVVHLAEGLGLVPRGTHDARLFIRPAELEGQAARVGLQFEHLVWERPALLESLRTWTIHLRSAHSGLGYSAFFRKGRA